MDAAVVANLQPGDGDIPIEIKVIRKWVSYGRKSECCYLFIDKNGNAIEACACLGEKSYFDMLIQVDGCYCVSNFMCETEKTFFVTVPHKTRIRLDRATKVEQIPTDGFPVYHFNLLPYKQLISRLDDHRILTDYMGKVENVVFKIQGITTLKIKVESLSGKMIEATFWDEMAKSFDRQAIDVLPSPVIVVVTSMKVTQYQGNLQLTATPASYIYINPTIPEAASVAAEFVVRDNEQPILKIQYQKSKDVQLEKQRNRFTLGNLLSQNPNRYRGVQFTCKGSLLSIDQTKGWFYKACNQCRKKLQKRGNMLACEDHEQVTEPKNLYLINGHLKEGTSEAKIVFFDDAATMLVQKDCSAMIDELGYTDPHALPAPFSILIGQTKIFQLHFTRFCKSGAIEFVADAVFEDTINPDKENNIQTDFINKPNTSTSSTQSAYASKTPTVTVDVPLMNPATPDKTSNEHITSTLITPPPAETQQHQKTSSQKQLFHTPLDGQTSQPPKKQKKCVADSDEDNKTHVGLEGKTK